MRLFHGKGHAVKKWHARAMIIDQKETKLTIISKKTLKQVPAWVYKKYASQHVAAN